MKKRSALRHDERSSAVRTRIMRFTATFRNILEAERVKITDTEELILHSKHHLKNQTDFSFSAEAVYTGRKKYRTTWLFRYRSLRITEKGSLCTLCC